MEDLSSNPGELTEEQLKLLNREVGAKILVQSGFRGRHQETVDSSFERARKWHDKLVGKNDERRIDAYLERLDRSIKKLGSKHEQLLWQSTVDSLIVKPEDISDSYWKTQEQILRDNGQGRELSEDEKEYLIREDIQKNQRESLESWTNYLSHEDCPYPTWFKVYAIEGVSKMGVYDKSTMRYKKRDNGSVAPYPRFNPATLAKVYDAIISFYGINPSKDLGVNQPSAEDEARAAELDALVQSGNFNKLYSRLLLSEKTIMKTPERTEDIDGEWVEYGLGDEDAIASAADGTPWCVASPSVGRSYLTTGLYGDDYDDYDDRHGESKAKFIFFHLHDKDGRLADNACASIRLDTDGNVAEISGLKDGQALEDSLVPIVEEKVRSLPGGEKFLKAFADKQTLIALDRKIQYGKEITKEDFRFIWELDRPIETLDTYNVEDPRIEEFRKKYDSEYAAEKGYIIPDTTLEQIEESLEKYLTNDPELKSNLLTYALKKSGKTDGLGLANLERIKNLETYESENYIFMLPKDQWKKGKIELPNDPEHRSLAPSDLTAILKDPVAFDYNYETVNEKEWIMEIYSKEWIGREVRYFSWSKELFTVERELLKPNGYSIPESWDPIVDGLEREIGSADGREISTALREKLKLSLGGSFDFSEPKDLGRCGYYWSSMIYNGGRAYGLSFSLDDVKPMKTSLRHFGYYVRCVTR